MRGMGAPHLGALRISFSAHFNTAPATYPHSGTATLSATARSMTHFAENFDKGYLPQLKFPIDLAFFGETPVDFPWSPSR